MSDDPEFFAQFKPLDKSREERKLQVRTLLNGLRALFESAHDRLKRKEYADPLYLYRHACPEGFKPLFPVVRAILAVPCTSAPAECLFSTSGNIVSKRRAFLSPTRVRDSVIVVENVQLFADDEDFCMLVGRRLSHK